MESKEHNWLLDSVKIEEDEAGLFGFRLCCSWNQTNLIMSHPVFLELVDLVTEKRETKNWTISTIDTLINIFSHYNFVELLIPLEVYNDLKELLTKYKGAKDEKSRING